MLVAKLAWLEGQLHWRNGRVAWATADGELTPEPADLARAQRSLHKLRQYPLAGPQALGDAEGWMAERQARLELAKQLAGISAPDPAGLVERAHGGQSDALEQLAKLLTAEALCVEGPPASPAAALLACRERAEPVLRGKAEDEDLPHGARALAALVLGALHRKLERKGNGAPPPGIEWAERAYRRGLRHGLPREPGLAVMLLAHPEGARLVHRLESALDPARPLRLEPSRLRAWLAEGTPAPVAVALAEAVRDAGPLAERYLDYRYLLEHEPLRTRRKAAEALQRERQAWVKTLRELLLAYAETTRDPEVVRLIASFAERMLALGEEIDPEKWQVTHVVQAIHEPLREGRCLPRPLQRAWLELIVGEHALLWSKALRGPCRTHLSSAADLRPWLNEQWRYLGLPALRLLAQSRDPELVREAIRAELHAELSGISLPSPEYYRYVLSIPVELEQRWPSAFPWRLRCALEDLPTVAEARRALQPLVQAVAGAPPSLRSELLEDLLDQIPYSRRQHREMPPRLARYVPALLRFNPGDGAWVVCYGAIEAVGVLDQSAPDRAEAWLVALLAAAQQWLRADSRLADQLHTLGDCVRLGLALAEGAWDLFRTVVLAALTHPSRQTRSSLEVGIGVLPRFSGLRAALAQVFPRQPHRCLELIARLGHTTQLDAEILAPLRLLETPGELRDEQPWQEVLRLAPDLEPLVRSYVGSQEILGRPTGPPPGVVRALNLPRKLAGELAHLERRISEGTAAPGILARVASLQERLRDKARLEAAMRPEIRQRLTDTAAEARLDAAHQQVLACYRARLEQVAGPLPEGLELTEDWLNAALLSASVQENRNLLKRLLRACATGDRRWRERHPENVRFLTSLQAQGGDAERWQSAHPRRYRCPELPGGVVRLRLERDPLHVLQMGNYFDTCLSFDGCNSFSTVANACELNKRVLYVRDAAGRVVARKLIGINAAGRLLGYRTYTTLSGEHAEAVRNVVREYLIRFAGECGLQLSEEGTVPRLFAEQWYDDGVCPWSGDEGPGPAAGKRAGKRAAARENGDEEAEPSPEMP
jgi:hypothetical protein